MTQTLSEGLLSGARLLLNADGKLIRLEAFPLKTPPVDQPVNWDSLFSAARLERARFIPSAPQSEPPMLTDTRLAWTGTYADNRTESLRVEAASWQGRPVLFDVQAFPAAPPSRGVSNRLVFAVAVPLLILAGLVTAWRNLRSGRSDRRGAAVIAWTTFLAGFGGWALAPGHLESSIDGHSLAGLGSALSVYLFPAAIVWAFYIALSHMLGSIGRTR